ncbi:MAG TPA: glycoside hydrolase family 15 protein [Steroidobacteraceae bacterium]
MPSRIEDYALLSDCETAALVARDGSVDWLCWPRFDSGACFAALLGTPEHGRWQIAPQDKEARIRRRYLPHTLILETEFETAAGSVRLVDFMPLRDAGSSLMRLVIGQSGQLAMHTELIVRYDYGNWVPWVTRLEDGAVSAVAGPHRLTMRTPVALRGEDLKTVGEFTVNAGQTIPFVLSYSESHRDPPPALDSADALTRTERFWREWSANDNACGEYSDLVKRSLITLKALTYLPTGGIVAAATTALPEQPGGTRNWDYRFCWLRDATFTLQAMMNGGHFQEAQAWRDWLLRALAGNPAQVQIMYGIAGERRLTEWEVPWLPGYHGARPVRIGNAAAEQRQHDLYGEVMDTMHHARLNQLSSHEAGWALQIKLLEHLQSLWEQPDRGMWEIRGDPRHFTHSKVMAWVAFDRSIKSAEKYRLEGPVEHWKRMRRRIHEQVCRRAYNADLGAFVQSYGASELDASELLLAQVGFLPPSDPRIRGTVEAIGRDLMVDGLIRRYRTEQGVDGLPPGEGAFLACSFWYADNLILLDRRDEARCLFERLIGLCNDVGLLAEQYDSRRATFLGNFPQAFSHVALINTAYNLGHATNPARQRTD